MESGFRGMGRAASDAVRTAVRALFPHHCVTCGAEGRVLCDDCLMMTNASIRGVFCCPACGTPRSGGRRCDDGPCTSYPLDGLVAMGRYSDPALRALLHLYKYEGVLEAGEVLTGLFRRFLKNHAAAFTIGTAACASVPMHRVRRALRGLDQARTFAETGADVLGLSLGPDPLIRTFGRTPQARIRDHGRRMQNVSGAFMAVLPAEGDWILVDDVFTTGATMRECASLLKGAGAGAVWGIAVLRG